MKTASGYLAYHAGARAARCRKQARKTTFDMADDDKDSRRDNILDLTGAVVLALTTALAAFAAYESSLWGGNQATAYTQATITLGEANRELLHASQERAFDTAVWLEHMNANQPVHVDTKQAGGHDPIEVADEQPQTKEQIAAALADDLTAVDDGPLSKKLDKLLATRLELTAALKWTDEQHRKTTKTMSKEKRIEMARKLVDLAEKEENLAESQYALLEKLGLAESTDHDIDEALAKNPSAKAEMAKMEEEVGKLQSEAEKMLDKVAKPLFFESPAYEKGKARKYEELIAAGNKLFLDGQTYNTNGDNYTLTTVFYTVALFFAGLSSVLKKFPIKATFLVMGIAIVVGATIYMLRTPFA